MVKPYTKTVLYYGKEIQVPQKAKWIHTDPNGCVFWSVAEVPLISTCFDTIMAEIEYGSLGSLFNHTQMSTINWMLSQKRISDLPSVCTGLEQAPHPHADLMLKYAQIAQYSDKPWEEFQVRFYPSIDWVDCTNGYTGFFSTNEYRLKPQSVKPEVQVGQVWESSKSKIEFRVVSTDVCYNTDNLCIELNHTLDVGLDIPYTVTEDTLRKHFTLIK